jgi:argininosuccinate lyase
MAERLWEKGASLDAQVHAFTVGNDPELDRSLLSWDSVGSAAHARMLSSIGVLSKEDCAALLPVLSEIHSLSLKGEFSIPEEMEDCHTAIESYLVDKTGDAGRKIHTGRSRNDQVLLAMRLYLRDQILQQLGTLAQCARTCLLRFDEVGNLPMPGYTHMQPAMPASVGMWLGAYAESFLDLIREGLSLLDRINANPLGAASGFGVPLPLDRDLTARLLGFSRVQRNPIDVQNSRGRYELRFIRWGVDVAATVEKLAWDLIIYSTREYGFFSIPEALTTGSSIMPQKKNPDVLELMRGRAAKIRAAENELLWVIAKLPSNYHRDFQYTKEPVLTCAETMSALLSMSEVVLTRFTCNEKALEAGMTDELYATYDAYRSVEEGMPFREAYRETSKRIATDSIKKADFIKEFDSIDASVIKDAREAQRELLESEKLIEKWRATFEEVEANIFTIE